MRILKKYFAKITLFTVLACLCFIAFVIAVISRQPEEIKSGILYHLLGAMLLFLGFDVLLKLVLKVKMLWLWIIQILLLLGAIYIWIISE